MKVSGGGWVKLGSFDPPNGTVDLGIIAPEGPSAAVYLTVNECRFLAQKLLTAADRNTVAPTEAERRLQDPDSPSRFRSQVKDSST